MDWIKRLPSTRANFGLTHADLQISNMHITYEENSSNVEGSATSYPLGRSEISVFDFDDACYHFFVHDIAVAGKSEG